jgi:hypothetical protein
VQTLRLCPTTRISGNERLFPNACSLIGGVDPDQLAGGSQFGR